MKFETRPDSVAQYKHRKIKHNYSLNPLKDIKLYREDITKYSSFIHSVSNYRQCSLLSREIHRFKEELNMGENCTSAASR